MKVPIISIIVSLILVLINAVSHNKRRKEGMLGIRAAVLEANPKTKDLIIIHDSKVMIGIRRGTCKA